MSLYFQGLLWVLLAVALRLRRRSVASVAIERQRLHVGVVMGEGDYRYWSAIGVVMLIGV